MPDTEYRFYIRAKNDVGVGDGVEKIANTTSISQCCISSSVDAHCSLSTGLPDFSEDMAPNTGEKQPKSRPISIPHL